MLVRSGCREVGLAPPAWQQMLGAVVPFSWMGTVVLPRSAAQPDCWMQCSTTLDEHTCPSPPLHCRSYAYVQLPPPALTPGLQKALPSQAAIAPASRKGLAPYGQAATASASVTPGSESPGAATPSLGHGHGSEVQLASTA